MFRVVARLQDEIRDKTSQSPPENSRMWGNEDRQTILGFEMSRDISIINKIKIVTSSVYLYPQMKERIRKKIIPVSEGKGKMRTINETDE